MTIRTLQAATLAVTAALVLTTTLPTAAIAQVAAPQTAAMTRISDAGESRVDGVRDGEHEGVPVRFLDMTIRNTSGETTFPETIQKVWWQGSLHGRYEDARYRDLRRRGMYEYVKPGAVWAVTYIIPRRDDVLGVTISDPAERSSVRERLRTWDELRGHAPAAAASIAEPTAAPATARSREGADPITSARAAAASVPEPVREHLAPAASRLKDALKRRLPGFLR